MAVPTYVLQVCIREPKFTSVRMCESIALHFAVHCRNAALPAQAFSKADREEVDIAVHEGMDIVRTVLQEGMERALSGVRPGAMVA